MAKIKEYKPIQPEDRACFGTDEFEDNDGICSHCRFYSLCRVVEPKIVRKIDR